MTKTMKKALQTVGAPAVRWSEDKKQFYVRIGYSRSKSGKRQRRFHWLGKIEADAIALAVVIKCKWKAIKSKQGRGAVWADNTPSPSADAVENFLAETTEDAIETGQAEWSVPTLRLEQLQSLYDDYRKGKVDLGGAQGLKGGTYKTSSANVRLAMKFIDGEMPINALGYIEIERWKDAIFGAVGQRTAVNYCRDVKLMLDWADVAYSSIYQNPKGFAKLFSFRRMGDEPNIIPYDAIPFRTLMQSANDRERLYAYLCLNAGYTQSDIGKLLFTDIHENNGIIKIIRRRPKTSHQNKFESSHQLWPETANLLRSQLAMPNKGGLALLNPNSIPINKPLYISTADFKYDAIADAWDNLRNRSGVNLWSLKQLRKIGASKMNIKDRELCRLYKAGTIDSGDKLYVLDFWDKLVEPLNDWAVELRSDGVLF